MFHSNILIRYKVRDFLASQRLNNYALLRVRSNSILEIFNFQVFLVVGSLWVAHLFTSPKHLEDDRSGLGTISLIGQVLGPKIGFWPISGPVRPRRPKLGVVNLDLPLITIVQNGSDSTISFMPLLSCQKARYVSRLVCMSVCLSVRMLHFSF